MALELLIAKREYPAPAPNNSRSTALRIIRIVDAFRDLLFMMITPLFEYVTFNMAVNLYWFVSSSEADRD